MGDLTFRKEGKVRKGGVNPARSQIGERPPPPAAQRPTKLPPHMDPMSPDEVDELLRATLHGALPQATVQRMMATLADWGPVVRKARE